MIKNLNLGIVFNHDGIVINHRSLLKILLNPFLRTAGWQIATKTEGNEIGMATLCKCPPIPLKFSFDYPLRNGETVVKRRRIV